MINPFQPATEIDEPDSSPPPTERRPPIHVFAAIIFVCIAMFCLISGSIIESGGAALVGFACWSIGKRTH